MLSSFSKNEILLIIAIAVVLGYIVFKFSVAFIKKRHTRPSKSLDLQDHYQAINLRDRYQKAPSERTSDDISSDTKADKTTKDPE